MTWTVSSCFVTLAILFLWRVEELAEACSCFPAHPQQLFCSADVVIRAKITGKQVVEVGNNIYGTPITQIKYDIKRLKTFKGPADDIDAIYTASSSSLCGVNLEIGKDYVITGRLDNDGKMHVTLCQYVVTWDSLSSTQRLGLIQRYEMGCDCKVTRCTSPPCMINSPAECLWTDRLTDGSDDGAQAQHYACIKRNDDSCAWYRGATPPKSSFLDILDP